MSERTAEDLAQENLERWRRFYRLGLIDRRHFIRALLVGGAGAAAFPLLSACGGGGAAPAPSGGPSAGASSSAASSGGAPKSGKDTFVTAFDNDMPNLDPHMHNLRDGIILYYQLFDNLGVRDLKTMQIGPHLATSWKPIEPTVWEMELRQDVKFHNGDPFTGETVKFNWERIINPAQKSQQRGNHEQIVGVDVVDKYKVHVKTKAPYPIFVERLQNFQMVSEKVVKEKGDAWVAQNPIGTGPYKFVEWKRDQHIAMERNNDYWGPKAGFPKLTVRIIKEKTTQIAELLAGNLDNIRALPFDQRGAVDASPVARAAVQKILRVNFCVMDARGRTSKTPFTDKRVRQAANHAVDIDGYIKKLQPGGDRTPALVNPMHFGFDPSIKPFEYDPDKAKKLIADAGVSVPYEFRWIYANGDLTPNGSEVVQAMQRDLEKVGLKGKIQTMDGNTANTLSTSGQAGPFYGLTSWGSYSVFDADGILWDMLHSSSIFSYYENKEFDDLIAQGRTSLDNDLRKKVYAQAQQIIREDAPMIFGWGLHGMWGISKAVKFDPSPDEIDRYYAATPA